MNYHDDVIEWKHFPRYWPFVRGIHRSAVNSPHKGQWRGALMFSLICTRINGWVNNGEAGDLRSHRAHDDIIVMYTRFVLCCVCISYRWMLPIFVRVTSLELELYDCPSASEAIWRIWIIVSHGHLKVHCKTTTNKAQETCVHICRTAFGITGPLWGESTGHRWTPLTNGQ